MRTFQNSNVQGRGTTLIPDNSTLYYLESTPWAACFLEGIYLNQLPPYKSFCCSIISRKCETRTQKGYAPKHGCLRSPITHTHRASYTFRRKYLTWQFGASSSHFGFIEKNFVLIYSQKNNEFFLIFLFFFSFLFFIELNLLLNSTTTSPYLYVCQVRRK